jgi:hypothetical protein
MKKVFFDESGNTGENLFDPGAPVFVLASCCFSHHEENTLFNGFKSFSGPEIKFKNLRKTDRGRQAIIALFGAAEVSATSVTAAILHKPYMAVTKYCDIVIEPSMKQFAVNMYRDGCNMATANLLYNVMPTFLNEKTWQSFLAAFVHFIRDRSPSALGQGLQPWTAIFLPSGPTQPHPRNNKIIVSFLHSVTINTNRCDHQRHGIVAGLRNPEV